MKTLDAVVKSVVVGCGVAEAFGYFTADFGRWWPAATHSVVAYGSEFNDRPEAVVMQPWVGGRIYERTRAGEEPLWGTVLAWEPPGRLVFSFHPGRGEETAQTVEVAFEAAGEGTRVTLVHSGWERLGDSAERVRGSYEGGWDRVLGAAYVEFVRGCAMRGA